MSKFLKNQQKRGLLISQIPDLQVYTIKNPLIGRISIKTDFSWSQKPSYQRSPCNIPSRLNVTYFHLQFSKHFMLQILKYQKRKSMSKSRQTYNKHELVRKLLNCNLYESFQSMYHQLVAFFKVYCTASLTAESFTFR